MTRLGLCRKDAPVYHAGRGGASRGRRHTGSEATASVLDYAALPPTVAEEIALLRRRVEASGLPPKATDFNLLLGTWNFKAFGDVQPAWEENSGSPKRNFRALAYLAEVIGRMDLVAIQEVKRDLGGVRRLLEFLGPDWGLIITDVTLGQEGNAERLAFVFDSRRVQPSGLRDLRTAFGAQPKFYDQIAWFMGARDLATTSTAA